MEQRIFSFHADLLRFRADIPAFRNSDFFRGDHVGRESLKDIVWLSADGREMTDADWVAPEGRCLGIRYAVARGSE